MAAQLAVIYKARELFARWLRFLGAAEVPGRLFRAPGGPGMHLNMGEVGGGK